MRTDPAINNTLNAVLKDALTAINQTFLHARMLQNWGLIGIGETCYKTSIMAMKEGDRLIKRILFLEGLPNLQSLGQLGVGEDAEEIIGSDLDLFLRWRSSIQTAIKLCEEQRDFQSREHLDHVLEEVEEYIDFLETQQQLIADTGIQNYLQSQMAEED